MMIENSGGPYPIAVNGLPNQQAKEIRHIVENYSDIIATGKKIAKVIEDIPEPEKSVKRAMSKAITSKRVGRKKIMPLIVEPAENAWDASSFDPIIPIENHTKEKDKVIIPDRHFVKDNLLPQEQDLSRPKTWDQIPSKYIVGEQDEDTRDSLLGSRRKLSSSKPIKNLDPNHLPSIEEAIYGSCEKGKSEWMKDLVSPPSGVSRKKGE
jgi:hypothetical protein